MTPERRVACARALIEDELFNSLMNELEASAIDTAIYAKPAEHDARAAALSKAKAIRDLRAELAAIVRNANQPRKDAPA
jgi:hypothetical protein